MAEFATDQNYSRVFTVTFKTFTTTQELLQVLYDRFKEPPPDALSNTLQLEWQNQVQIRY